MESAFTYNPGLTLFVGWASYLAIYEQDFFRRIQVSLKFLLTKRIDQTVSWPKFVHLFSTTTHTPLDQTIHLPKHVIVLITLMMLLVCRQFIELGT